MAETDTTKNMVVDTATSFVSIEAGETVSSNFNVEACSLLGVYIPSNWTAGAITIQVNKFQHDEPSYTIAVEGAPYSQDVLADTFVPIPPYITATCQKFRIISSVAQVSEVKLELALAPLFSAT